MIYLDHAASSHPKAPGVTEAVHHALTDVGANPGRSGHRLSLMAASLIFEAREQLAGLLGISDSRRVLLGSGCTWGLNLALNGLLRPDDHVVVGPMQHNSVMRPLRHLQQTRNLALEMVRADRFGRIEPGALRAACRKDTRLVIINHASNVNGVLQDLDGIRQEIPEMTILVDGAQTVGAVPIQIERQKIDLLAFSGHKGLLGPQGTGGLALGAERSLEPLQRGGTGSASEFEKQPSFLPDRFEAGTPNTPGLAGLAAGVRWVREQGVETIRSHELEISSRLRTALESVPGLRFHSPSDDRARVATLALDLPGRDPADLARRLEQEQGVMMRVGLHCAPLAHRHLGTFPSGTLRLSPGPFTTRAEADCCAACLARIAEGAGS